MPGWMVKYAQHLFLAGILALAGWLLHTYRWEGVVDEKLARIEKVLEHYHGQDVQAAAEEP